jgi:hypothetical protein
MQALKHFMPRSCEQFRSLIICSENVIKTVRKSNETLIYPVENTKKSIFQLYIALLIDINNVIDYNSYKKGRKRVCKRYALLVILLKGFV